MKTEEQKLFYHKDGFEEERTALYPIILREYNPEYPAWFAEERDTLTRLIGAENIVRIRHIGSTSVPDLLAKPTIDILLEIADITDTQKLIAALHEPEYICLNPPDMPTPPPHLMFIKGYTDTGFAERVFHIHVRYKGDWDEPLFRDYLIAHTDTAAKYAELKRGLFGEFEHNRDGYTYAKTEFIKRVMTKAREESPLGYIMNLRRYVGHMPIIMSGACVIVVNENGELLLQRRRDNGMWGCAGGSLEFGESLEDCAKRELFEETGLMACTLKLLKVFSGHPPFTYPNGDVVQTVIALYLCDCFKGELKAPASEVSELHWFAVNQLPENISPPDRKVFRAYMDSHKQIIDAHDRVLFWSTFDSLITESELVIDRPKGTKHPRFDFIYPLDYGYLKNTASMDGGGIDVWRGSLPNAVCDAIICTIDTFKRDSEIKILLGCTEDEKDEILRFHNDSHYMKGLLIRRES